MSFQLGSYSPERHRRAAMGNRVQWEFIDIMRMHDGKIVEDWTSMDLAALRAQMRPHT